MHNNKTTNKKWFTLIEMLIVIAIAAILATVTLNLNWTRISEMQALNEREQWLSKHQYINRELINTTYLDWKKISYLLLNYQSWSSTISLSWFDTTNSENYWSQEQFNYHLITSWSLIIKKAPLSLGCEIIPSENNTIGTTPVSNKIYLEHIQSQKSFCFQLNTALCSRSKCQ